MKPNIPTSGVTIREIAEAEDFHEVYVRRLVHMKGFPDPIGKVGRNWLFDYRQVNAYFRRREKHKAA